MNLDELKITWQSVDRRLQATRLINEKIIVSMITERSTVRFSTVRRQYIAGFVWMVICLGAGVAILLTNPFDYRFTIQYVPMGIFTVCLALLLIDMVRSFLALQRVTIHSKTISESLRQIIAIYERPKRILRYVVLTFIFSQVVLFPLSFLPKTIESRGLWFALAERLIPISIALILLFVAHKLGAFKERNVLKFKDDLNELDELNKMSLELNKD